MKQIMDYRREVRDCNTMAANLSRLADEEYITKRRRLYIRSAEEYSRAAAQAAKHLSKKARKL